MTAFDNTKYDLEINGVGFRCSAYNKREQSTFVPRLAAGDATESAFDLLRSKTLKGFGGGDLQKEWVTDNSAFGIEGMYPRFDDGILYPAPTPVNATNIGTGRYLVRAKCSHYFGMYIATTSTTGAASQAIYRVTNQNVVSSLTLPASLANKTYTITDMVIWGRQLWVTASDLSTGTGTTGFLYYCDISSATLIEITAGTGYFQQLAVFKNQLYGTKPNVATTDPDNSLINDILFRYTGTTATRAQVELARVPSSINQTYADLFVFNNRVYLSRMDGLYAWDGTSLVTIDDQQLNPHLINYRYPSILKGYLYYWMPDGLYRFNGSLIEKVYDSTLTGWADAMISGNNRLWMVFYNSSNAAHSSRYDKAMGYDYSTGSNFDGTVMTFDGRAMYTYCRVPTQTRAGSPLNPDEGTLDDIAYFNEKLYIFTYADPTNISQTIEVNTETSSLYTGNKSWAILTSVFDGDFPIIDKNLDNLELVFDGYVPSDQTIALSYRTSGFDGSTAFTSLGNFSSQTELRRYIFKSLGSAGLTFRRVQFKLTGTTDVRYGISKLVVRYMLSPDFKWQWNLSLNTTGDDAYAPLVLADGSDGTQSVASLRDAIYTAKESDVPVGLIDCDQLDLDMQNLTTNGEFETNITGWSGYLCTVAQSSTTANVGVYSLAATITGLSPGNPVAVGANAGLTIGLPYRWSAYVKAPVGTTIFINAPTVAGTYNQVAATGGWQFIQTNIGNAASTNPNIEIGLSGAAVSDIFYIDTVICKTSALSASDTSVYMLTTALVKGSAGFIKIDDEIIQYTAKTSTSLTVVRGVLGTTAAIHPLASKIFLYYRVIVRNIQNERIIMTDDALDQTSGKSRPSELSVVIQEV